LILGGLTPYMLKWLKITDGEPVAEHDPHNKIEKGLTDADKYVMIEDETGEKTNKILGSSFFKWIFAMDDKYISC